MPKILVRKKNGSVYIRKKSNESAETIDTVAPAKVRSWLALSEASHNAAGKTMEEVIAAVFSECSGKIFKETVKRIEVSQEEYDGLLIQCAKKGITRAKLNTMVIIKKSKEKTPEEMVEEFIASRS